MIRRHKAPRKKTAKRRVNQELDLLMKERVLEHYGPRCLRCGTAERIAASHILPKGKYPRLRFEVLNILPLCTGCHIFWWHKNPIEAQQWLEKRLPGRMQQLQVMAATAGKVDAKTMLLVLRAEVRGDGKHRGFE